MSSFLWGQFGESPTSPKDGWIGWSGTSGVDTRTIDFHVSKVVENRGTQVKLDADPPPRSPRNPPLDLDYKLHRPNKELIHFFFYLLVSHPLLRIPKMVPNGPPILAPRHNDSGFMTGLTPDMFVTELQVRGWSGLKNGVRSESESFLETIVGPSCISWEQTQFPIKWLLNQSLDYVKP